MPAVRLPRDFVIHELPLSNVWIDHDGILWSLTKKAHFQRDADPEVDIDHVKSIVGENRVCIVADVTHCRSAPNLFRDSAGAALDEVATAIAVVSASKSGKMSASHFFNALSKNYPVAFFDDIDSARNWLNQFL